MFQNLANYLLGSVMSQESGVTAEGVQNDGTIRLRSEVQEDDWVLVDRDSEGNSDTCSVESLDDIDEEVPTVMKRVLTRSSSTSSLLCASNMEESWFVTPPPCFTSQGPVHMETSPLENLLIEHPSMSVYRIHPSRRHFTVTVPVRSASSASRLSNEEEDLEVEDEDVDGQDIALVNRIPRLNRLQVMQQQERQRYKHKRAQKVNIFLYSFLGLLEDFWIEKSQIFKLTNQIYENEDIKITFQNNSFRPTLFFFCFKVESFFLNIFRFFQLF
ncbi:uncharacterized protein LOC130904238 isoform X2 [Diorhabda carinulata]|nr:uncharacterized protein LOC130904238 isoform X2 [Diorhabda carinulata]XP_057672869.1 uncharacterized protein LOC130904238 isoform X2 [Diorhabda carinulata]XP_057672870.1 uncharacterized protein LOC130904238 isoform X2 [Diorhabda carinulata]XP_057672871.1 uncharacterized protein LOC130904238 isoform X2 [Diorhabda carinulata]XP_057672872.1 uncharacterized protein LOC130904238 isoform X2 [Diorhabda carinulata]